MTQAAQNMGQQLRESVKDFEQSKAVVQFGKALAKFDVQEKVISDLEEATKLKITDTASEKVVRKHRQNAKALEVQIEKRRLELNREFKEKTDEAAGLIAPRVTAAYNALDEKIKAVETEREARKAEKELAEKLRIGKIQWYMDGLEVDCSLGLEYNTPSSVIFTALECLKDIEISESDYQERTEEAKAKLSSSIASTEIALKNREKFEADQAEAARVKAEQEAESKRLEEERAKLEADRKAQEEANRKAVEAEAEIRRQEEDAIRAEREKLEHDKAVAAREAVWDEAHKENFNRDHSAAIIENDRRKAEAQAAQADFEDCHASALVEHEEYLKRQQLIAQDKLKIQEQINLIDTAISDIKPCDFATDEAAKVIADLYIAIKEALSLAEKLGAELR